MILSQVDAESNGDPVAKSSCGAIGLLQLMPGTVAELGVANPAVPPPRFHPVRNASVLVAASPWRPRIAPKSAAEDPAAETAEPDRTGPAG